MGWIRLSSGEKVEDRRKNGARIKLDTSDWIKIVSLAVVIILGWGNTKWNIEAHEKKLDRHETQIKTIGDMALESKTDVVNLKTSIDRIDNNVMMLLQRIK